MQKSILFVLLPVLLFSCKNGQKEKEEISEEGELTVPELIAYAHGLENWDYVEGIHFTFNVERGETQSNRSWSWKPKTDDVYFFTPEDTLHYNRKNLDSLAQSVDRRFINDKYWLLAPFQLVWDKNIDFTHTEIAVAPISGSNMQKLTIVYPEEGGYTPGDAYDFYFGDDFLIKEWTYRKGNAQEPSMSTTWEDYENQHGMKFATMRRNAEDTFSIYFTNIEVIKRNE